MGADKKRLSSEQTLWMKYGKRSQVVHAAGGVAIAVWTISRVLLAVVDEPGTVVWVLLRTAVVASEITAGVVCVLILWAWWQYKDKGDDIDKGAYDSPDI